MNNLNKIFICIVTVLFTTNFVCVVKYKTLKQENMIIKASLENPAKTENKNTNKTTTTKTVRIPINLSGEQKAVYEAKLKEIQAQYEMILAEKEKNIESLSNITKESYSSEQEYKEQIEKYKANINYLNTMYTEILKDKNNITDSLYAELQETYTNEQTMNNSESKPVLPQTKIVSKRCLLGGNVYKDNYSIFLGYKPFKTIDLYGNLGYNKTSGAGIGATIGF